MLSCRIGPIERIYMTLVEQLNSVVEEYFLKHPHLSINSLALKSGVGATTIRRIKTLSIKGDPAPHTVLNIVSAISNEKSLPALINFFDGEIKEMLQKAFGPYITEKIQHVYDVDLNEQLQDSFKYFIYKLASNRVGVSEEEVIDHYGKMGQEKLRELIKLKLVALENGRFHAKDKNFSLDINTAVKHLPELLKFYKPEQVHKGHNLFYSMSESLNKDGIKKIKDIQKEAIKKIYNVMQSPFYEGDLPFFTIDMSDTLTREECPREHMRGAIQ